MRNPICLACAALLIAAFSSSTAFAVDITTPGDPIVAIYNTTISGNSTASTPGTTMEGQFPTNEPAPSAIDNNTSTKYLNFGTGGGASVSSPTKGVNTGFYITPSVGATIINGIRVATANDANARDPLTVSIEGSNASGAALTQGISWNGIALVNLGIDTDPGRFTFGPLISFDNTEAYTSYRVLVQSQRASANSTQYSEIELHGVVIPEPGTLGLLSLGGALFTLRRRRA